VTSKELHDLSTEADAVCAAGDVANANRLLVRLAEIGDPQFDVFGLDELRLVMRTAVLLGQIADTRLVAAPFARSINAMQRFDRPAAEYIAPLYNLRAAYLASGTNDEANRLLPHIVEAARHAGIVSVDAMASLSELIPGFESAGYSEAAATLFRPIYETVSADTRIGWPAKVQVSARYGRLQLADGRPADAVETYRKTLEGLDAATSDADAAYARLALWNLTAEAHQRGNSLQAAEHAYETAISIADGSGIQDSQEAGVIYHNLAGLWLANSRRDRYPEAVALTRRSLGVADRLGERETSSYAAGLGQLANLYAGLGEPAAAQQSFDECFATFAAAADTDPADVADYRDDEGKFRLSSGQPESAAVSFAAVCEIRGGIAGLPRDKLSDSYGWLGVARFEHGDFLAASAAFREAIQLRLDQLVPETHRGDHQ
jgi:tetratricopeptide (TPR) repeat protein